MSLKVNINLLNQHCKPADWLADSLTDRLRHLGSQGTRTLEQLRHSKDIWAIRHSMHSKGTWVLRHSGHLGTWTLGHLKGTWTFGHSRQLGTWALETLWHSKDAWVLGNSRHLNTWALKHLGTQVLKVHLATRALRH